MALEDLEDLQVRNLVRNRRLATAISDGGWSRLRRWVEDYGTLHHVPVVAAPPEYTSQDGSGILPDGSPCPARVRKSLSVRMHVCPHCGLILDRDHHAALMILQRGLALAREHGFWPQETAELTELTELRGSVGHKGTERLGTAGLLRRGESPSVAPAGGSRNLWHSCRSVSIFWLCHKQPYLARILTESPAFRQGDESQTTDGWRMFCLHVPPACSARMRCFSPVDKNAP